MRPWDSRTGEVEESWLLRDWVIVWVLYSIRVGRELEG